MISLLQVPIFVGKEVNILPKTRCPQETSALQLEVEVVLDARLPGEAGFGASNKLLEITMVFIFSYG